MQIFIENQQTDLPIDTESVSRVVSTTLEAESSSCDELTIHFVDRSTISNLHLQFFDDPSETDCITLPIDPSGTKPYCVLGEVFVCPHVGVEYSKTNGHDPYMEVTLYVIHGILHLLGYKDLEIADIANMRAAEKRIQQVLEVAKVSVTPPE